jgi:hypothetical protein
LFVYSFSWKKTAFSGENSKDVKEFYIIAISLLKWSCPLQRTAMSVNNRRIEKCFSSIPIERFEWHEFFWYPGEEIRGSLNKPEFR